MGKRLVAIAAVAAAGLVVTPYAEAHDQTGAFIAGAAAGVIVGSILAPGAPVFYGAPPVVYASPPVYYPPPGVYYTPPVVVYRTPPPRAIYYGPPRAYYYGPYPRYRGHGRPYDGHGYGAGYRH